MFSRVPKDLKELKKPNHSINEVLRYYDESRKREDKIQAKNIWINKRKNMRKKAQLGKENQSELEEAFNRNLKRLEQKKIQLKEEEFQKKKRKYTKQYEQKQRNDLKPGKGIRYSNSKTWKNRNNKTKKSPLSREQHQSTDALTPQERARLIEESLYKGGKRRKKRKTRKKKKRKTRKRKRRLRKRRKTRKKRAGKSTFIKQSKINEGIQGCNTLHSISEIHKCRNMGGHKKYKKKKMLGKIHLPQFKRPHLPHMKTESENHNEILANMEWEDWRKEK